MPKVKVKKQNTFIDMTAMSDVTVLLLTFFMLTSTFIKKEPVMVNTPGSVSDIKIPETNILQVLVDPQGKVFLSLDNQDDKVKLLERMGQDYNVQFTPEELQVFKKSVSFGVPMEKMKAFLDLSTEQQDAALKDYGVPTDSTNNQFKKWVLHSRDIVDHRLYDKNGNADVRMVLAIKADATTPYAVIKTVLGSLQEIRENRYSLVTTLGKMPDNV